VATYNRSTTLVERCIASILEQTYGNWEAIIVGDACTDDTAERVAAIHDPRVRFVNLPERGRYPEEPWRRWCVAGSQAMNHGLELARGELITHLDDDDAYASRRLELLVRLSQHGKYDFVWHPFYLESDDGQWRLITSDKLKRGFVTTSTIFYRSWFRAIPWTMDAHWLLEPGDWNRIRRIKYMNASIGRHPDPLLRHFRESNQVPASGPRAGTTGGA
jgi:glycosyltransferase involved in cell wall biosynthesis